MRHLTVLLLIVTLALPASGWAQPQTVTSTDLIENAAALDGQTVHFTGEVIGDIMNRGDHAWINVSDGSNAMGVWADRSLTKDVGIAGRYGVHGDTVEISGTFHRACRDHGGDMDIHADQITLVSPGYSVPVGVNGWELALAVALTVAAIALIWTFLQRRA